MRLFAAVEPKKPPPDKKQAADDVLLYGGLGALALLTLAVAIVLIRRRLLLADLSAEGVQDASALLTEFREAEEEGELEPEEFKKIRANLSAGVRGGATGTTGKAGGDPAKRPRRPPP